MTDEEKAESKWNEIAYKYTRIEDMACRIIKDDFIKAHLDGLAEGREKSAKDIEVLTKENEKLKAQIEQLSNDNNVLKTTFLIQGEQIEKMKTLFELIKNRSCTTDIYNIAVEGMEIA